MNVSVIVPRAGDCPHRARAWDWIRPQYAPFEVIEGWGDPDQWSKAEAVDEALTRATGDLLVIADADVWSEHLTEALCAVTADRARWAVPHRRVIRLTTGGTEQFMAGEYRQLVNDDDDQVDEHHQSVLGGGIVVLHRDTYERIPLDRRFVGWGGEDSAWGCALRGLAGPPHIVNENLWHLWHPPQPRLNRKLGNEANDELRGRYVAARWVAVHMRTLLEEGRCHSLGSSTRP